ncbi:hypothetical protein RZS28_18840 (plasmid) [Methylocapsa polymorpha]|uniref:Uncharacterized protein n=1 Tax=Methylocapsa polymorpha TaxID=3080828 RepID=A0ABZ0HYC6_9HYPH|nr:hypothetical protein RZS28_18840 [Methylocapsa sp. RX1]
MRDIVVAELRRRWRSARIIHELPLRYSAKRIDLAAITEAEIISVEIKSSRDVVDRVEAQVRAFLPISTRVIVALAPKWNEKLPLREERHPNHTSYIQPLTEAQNVIRRIGDSCVETWTVDSEGQGIEVTDDAFRKNEHPWPARILDILDVAELVEIAIAHRLSVAKRPVHADLVALCCGSMTGREVTAAVCRALRAREAFGASSDPPIKAADPPDKSVNLMEQRTLF